MEKQKTFKNSITDLELALAGPVSVFICLIFTWVISLGPDGGWAGMGFMYTGLAIILIVHIITPFILISRAIEQRKNKKSFSKSILWGTAYYGLILALLLAAMGPKELLKDVAVLLSVFFR